MSQVARARKKPMLKMSVTVVRKMLEAVAGSAPRRRRMRGIHAPAILETMQLVTIARKPTKPRWRARGLCCQKA